MAPCNQTSDVNQPHIVLVACAATKREAPIAARDLYLSTLFSESRRFAEANGDSWYILSALHCVLDPARVTERYDLTLNTMAIAQRREWAAQVNETLLDLLPAGCRVTILAGMRYREFVEPFLRQRGFHVEVPLASLRIGEQVQWLQHANATRKSAYSHQSQDVFG